MVHRARELDKEFQKVSHDIFYWAGWDGFAESRRKVLLKNSAERVAAG
jgi:hypothetical protein